MPEIGEVARCVDAMRRHLLNRTITTCTAFDDDIIYGKVGTSASKFQTALTSKRVTNVGQQGKYFYMTLSSPPHAVMHLGMTGWVKFSTEDTAYYKQAKEVEREKEEWPPKYVKFLLKCEKETGGEGREAVEVAFVDARRLARIRLVECEAGDIRKTSPLKENGPDPVIDKEVVTVEWLTQLLGRKRVPVKALLLDQANISGVGNWVADEVLYQARIHPEQYSNTFGAEQIQRLHEALLGVCGKAVAVLADSKQFPENWLMKYRWDAGKKDKNVLPNGERIVHLKVGGRTSAIVPSVQKKTAAVAGDVESGAEDEVKEKPASKRKRKAQDEDDDEEAKGVVAEKPAKPARSKKSKSEAVKEDSKPKPEPKKARGGRAKKAAVKDEDGEEEHADAGADEAEDVKHAATPAKSKQAKGKKPEKVPTPGERRSARTKAK